MTNEELNTALYKKLFAEQEVFKAWLVEQPPGEILRHAYEYTVREDFLLSLEYNDLTDSQAAALLAASTPLDDLFHQYEKLETGHMEEVWDCLECRAEQIKAAKAVQEEPLNVSCKEAIEAAIDSHYKENRLDARAAAQEVLDRFGSERVLKILAATVRDKNRDARISLENKIWAQAVPMPEVGGGARWIVDSHPGLTNLFLNQVRELLREKNHTLDQTKPPKKHEMER